MAPEDVHVLIPEPMDMLLYMAKGTLLMRLRLWLLGWGDYPGLSNLIT